MYYFSNYIILKVFIKESEFYKIKDIKILLKNNILQIHDSYSINYVEKEHESLKDKYIRDTRRKENIYEEIFVIYHKRSQHFKRKFNKKNC